MRSARKMSGEDATAIGAGVLDVEAALADTGIAARLLPLRE